MPIPIPGVFHHHGYKKQFPLLHSVATSQTLCNPLQAQLPHSWVHIHSHEKWGHIPSIHPPPFSQASSREHGPTCVKRHGRDLETVGTTLEGQHLEQPNDHTMVNQIECYFGYFIVHNIYPSVISIISILSGVMATSDNHSRKWEMNWIHAQVHHSAFPKTNPKVGGFCGLMADWWPIGSWCICEWMWAPHSTCSGRKQRPLPILLRAIILEHNSGWCCHKCHYSYPWHTWLPFTSSVLVHLDHFS